MAGDGGRPVGFGVVGLNWGLGRCAALEEVPDARLVAVAARSEATARRGGEQLGVEWYTDYRAMLARDDLDVVAVYTPSAAHLEIAVAAARAGKHVLTTKPIEITVERTDALIEACRRAGVKLATEYAMRFQPGNYLGYRAIADGAVGQPVLGEFSYKCYRPQDYYQGTHGTWAVDGGGAVMNQAIHTVDLMLWYMGPAATVTAHTGTLTHRMEAEDTAVAVVTFASGAMATLVGTTSFHNDRPAGNYGGGTVTRIEVGGTRGSFVLGDGKLTMWKSEVAAEPPTDAPPARNAFGDFARWVLDEAYDAPTLVRPVEARRSVELVEALYRSAREGKTVTLPLT